MSPGIEDMTGHEVPLTPDTSPTLYSCPQQQGTDQNPEIKSFIVIETWNFKSQVWES
jgi:hypothetical protein